MTGRSSLLVTPMALFSFGLLMSTLMTCSDAFSPLFARRGPSISNVGMILASSVSGNSDDGVAPGAKAKELKESLLKNIKSFRELQERDGDVAIDFGVKGGELNETSRAPRKVNYYAISQDVGKAADQVMAICDSLSFVSPIAVPTKDFGNKQNGTLAPLHGTWKLLFTTAADASFTSKNSTRGTAKVSNVVDATTGKLTNVIEFQPKPDGSKPALDQLNVVIRGKPNGDNRVDLQFKYAKIFLNKFFGLPLFGKRLRLYIPVPGPFITRLIVLFRRIIKFGKKSSVKRPPQAYFDVLYLDGNLRIQKTGEDNLFVQAKESWEEAKPLMQ